MTITNKILAVSMMAMAVVTGANATIVSETMMNTALGTKVNATGQTANGIMTTDNSGNVTVSTTIDASKISGLSTALTDKQDVSNMVTATSGFFDDLDSTTKYPSMATAHQMIVDMQDDISGDMTSKLDATLPETLQDENNINRVMVRNNIGNAVQAISTDVTVDQENNVTKLTVNHATAADSATNDGAGNNIASTYATKSDVSTDLATKQDKLSSGANGNVTITNNNSVTADTGVVKSVTANNGTVAVTRGTIATADIADGAVTGAKIANGTITNDDIASGAQIAVSKINGAEASVNKVVDKVNYNDYLGPGNNGTTYYPSMDVAQEMIDQTLDSFSYSLNQTLSAGAATVPVYLVNGTPYEITSYSGNAATATTATNAKKIPFGSESSTTYASIWVE